MSYKSVELQENGFDLICNWRYVDCVEQFEVKAAPANYQGTGLEHII